MDVDKLAIEIVDYIEKYKNLENLSWILVFEKIIANYDEVNSSNKDLVLIRVVREISRRGYYIQDAPFKLTK